MDLVRAPKQSLYQEILYQENHNDQKQTLLRMVRFLLARFLLLDYFGSAPQPVLHIQAEPCCCRSLGACWPTLVYGTPASVEDDVQPPIPLLLPLALLQLFGNQAPRSCRHRQLVQSSASERPV